MNQLGVNKLRRVDVTLVVFGLVLLAVGAYDVTASELNSGVMWLVVGAMFIGISLFRAMVGTQKSRLMSEKNPHVVEAVLMLVIAALTLPDASLDLLRDQPESRGWSIFGLVIGVGALLAAVNALRKATGIGRERQPD